MPLTVLTLNVGNPALERARRQRYWLARRTEDVFVLTETGSGPGTHLIADSYRDAGWSVTYPDHPDKERGVMLLSRLESTVDPIGAAMTYLPARLAGIVVRTDRGPVRVLGAYVPSRDATEAKTTRKRAWIDAFHQAYDATADDVPVLLLGDLNVLEPGHVPPHPGQFAPFETAFYTELTQRHGLTDAFRALHPTAVEHSWARRADLGYRYDHAHAATPLIEHLASCSYLHDTRHGDPALTDHSGLAVELTLTATTPLITSDPAADHEATLF
ncbi:exodeoxyribonuclease-3 [Amycolatopsis lexingtonensis]|uniref:Exodeoxyribonuclease-3 n=1 Tax=Amycolatopsis lexingtonensis TaxID=218822 RepID=A0ABR9HT27_9PSEU|nr:endonuclease/exonuclease/phosphatase family protein [Amycolatopsis lexingtonensis]MBE1494083.1 exodeoxyribonuclease-3 [Amycolatopsis lexingtonensis]